jgi:hypothetical protein
MGAKEKAELQLKNRDMSGQKLQGKSATCICGDNGLNCPEITFDREVSSLQLARTSWGAP